jgi:hypothetical protein
LFSEMSRFTLGSSVLDFSAFVAVVDVAAAAAVDVAVAVVGFIIVSKSIFNFSAASPVGSKSFEMFNIEVVKFSDLLVVVVVAIGGTVGLLFIIVDGCFSGV